MQRLKYLWNRKMNGVDHTVLAYTVYASDLPPATQALCALDWSKVQALPSLYLAPAWVRAPVSNGKCFLPPK